MLMNRIVCVGYNGLGVSLEDPFQFYTKQPLLVSSKL